MLNLNPARGALTSLQLLCALTALWLGTSAGAQQPAPPPALTMPHLTWVKSETSMSTETSGSAPGCLPGTAV